MGVSLAKLEKSAIRRATNVLKHFAATAVQAASDYKFRHLGSEAASVSFYAIFTVFPLLAFTVYFVGRLLGDGPHGSSAVMVVKILHDYVPAMQKWIEKGLFDAITGQAATNWVNAALLGWSTLGLFESTIEALEALPEERVEEDRAILTQLVLAVGMLGLFSLFIATVVFCEVVGSAPAIPFWLKDLPFELQDALFYGAHSRLLLGVVSVGIVTTLYKTLMPVRVRLRSAFLGALLFTGMLILSRSAYWIYLHYTRHEIETSYGIFSALILVMLWVHFSVSCLMFGGLFALHLDRAARKMGRRSSDSAPSSENHRRAA